MIVAIDAGHGYVKALSSRGQKVLFPSLIAPAPHMVDIGGFGQSAMTLIDDKAYIVGAEASDYAVPLWSHEKADDENTLRLILIAAARLGASGPTRLVTGLPLAWFGAQQPAFHDALTGLTGTVVTPDSIHTRLWFESVTLLPQGVAAAGPVLIASNLEPGPYLIVDVGYRTTDYIIVTKSPQGLHYDVAAAGSLPLGMHGVDERLATRLSEEHQTTFTAAQLAGQDSIVARGQRWNITPLRQEEEHALAQHLVSALVEKLDQKMNQILGLVTVGGGYSIFAKLPHVIRPLDPQWANVRGYLSAVIATPQSGVESVR